MTFSIREAAASDYEHLCALFDAVDALHRENLPHMFQAPAGAARSRDYILGLIADPAVGVFVAEVRGRLVGLLCVVIKESPDLPIFVRRRYAVVDNLVVRAEDRRAGIGRALMEAAHEWAAAAGADSIELNVYEFNRGAIEFYQTLGYETVSRKMGKRLDQGESRLARDGLSPKLSVAATPPLTS